MPNVIFADSPERLYLLLFSAVFFAFVLFFRLRRGEKPDFSPRRGAATTAYRVYVEEP